MPNCPIIWIAFAVASSASMRVSASLIQPLSVSTVVLMPVESDLNSIVPSSDTLAWRSPSVMRPSTALVASMRFPTRRLSR